MEAEASWEAWRRAEGGLCAREPVLRACVEADRASLHLRLVDFKAMARVREALKSLADQVNIITKRNGS